jgi:cytochrome c biogenesis protein CcmG, thiol:disulfide interchange protein DsbE
VAQGVAIGLVALLFILLAWSLLHDEGGDLSKKANAGELPSAPDFTLERLDQEGEIKLSSLHGKAVVLNVWASWCIPCHTEAPLLLKLAADKRIRVVGINQADQADNARRFLGRYGNPFVAVGVDPNRRASIEWGVYGVPETFVVGRDGRIVYKLIGEITPQNLETTVKPQIEKALAAATPQS